MKMGYDMRTPSASRIASTYFSQHHARRNGRANHPATFGPIACISRKFCASDSSPTLLHPRRHRQSPTRLRSQSAADLLTEHVHQLRHQLTFRRRCRYQTREITPSTSIPSVRGCRNLSATSFANGKPREMVTILIARSAPCRSGAPPPRFHASGCRSRTSPAAARRPQQQRHQQQQDHWEQDFSRY